MVILDLTSALLKINFTLNLSIILVHTYSTRTYYSMYTPDVNRFL